MTIISAQTFVLAKYNCTQALTSFGDPGRLLKVAVIAQLCQRPLVWSLVGGEANLFVGIFKLHNVRRAALHPQATVEGFATI